MKFTENELKVIEISLDLYSRLCMGQVENLDWQYRMGLIRKKSDQYGDLNNINRICYSLKQGMFNELTPNASYSIFSDKIHPNAITAIDVIEKIHNRSEEWEDLKNYTLGKYNEQ